MGWVVKVESKKKSAAMKWFPLHKTKVLGGAPDISLGQKYLTTADPFDPKYNTPNQHRDLKKLTCPIVYIKLHFQAVEELKPLYEMAETIGQISPEEKVVTIGSILETLTKSMQ